MEAVAKKPARHASAGETGGSAAKLKADKPARKPSAKSHPAKKPSAPKERPKAAPVQAEIILEKPAKALHIKNFYALGRRKTAVAQALLSEGNGSITVNQLPFEGYFQTADLQQIVRHPLFSLGLEKKMNIKAKIHGGGIHAQAESLRHAIARGLIAFNPESRRTLKKLGFLTRDPRVKERKKPGLKRARRAPQFSKR